MKKALFIMLSAALIVCTTVAGTLAWLTDTTAPVVNTFTVGDINITLTESENLDLKMVPGRTITKDPKVTVKAGSEACWLFVKVEKSGNFDSFMTFEIANGWTELTEGSGVYYRNVGDKSADGATDEPFPVISGNKVTVKNTVTKADLKGLTEATYPTLTLTAYAVQRAGFENAADAWAEASK